MDRLRRLALRLTGNTDDAEDLPQDLPLRLQPRIDEFVALERPRPFPQAVAPERAVPLHATGVPMGSVRRAVHQY